MRNSVAMSYNILVNIWIEMLESFQIQITLFSPVVQIYISRNYFTTSNEFLLDLFLD